MRRRWGRTVLCLSISVFPPRRYWCFPLLAIHRYCVSFASISNCIRPSNIVRFAMNGVESEFAVYLSIPKDRDGWNDHIVEHGRTAAFFME
jgi:hypothetical protein